MSTQESAPPSRTALWAGRVVSALPVVGLLLSATMKLSHAAPLVKSFVNDFGYPESALTPIGVAEIVAALLYAVPQTSTLGAVVLTGYLGGAIATHVRIGQTDKIVGPIVFAVLAWLGLYLRDVRLRALLPLRKLPAAG
jgi:hypothetical protein